ncbi:hypothetical protein D3C76_1188280 [compost metagenome]
MGWQFPSISERQVIMEVINASTLAEFALVLDGARKHRWVTVVPVNFTSVLVRDQAIDAD